MRLLPHKRSKDSKKSKNATREKLEEATFDLLAEKGFASISSRDISKRADTAVGQLTYYYKTKNELISEVIDNLLENLITSLNEYIEKADDKIMAIKDFFNSLVDEDEKTSRILVDLVCQALYDNILTDRASKFLKDLIDIISTSYKENNIENPEEKSEELINSVLGTIVRKNLNTRFIANSELNDNSYIKEKRKHGKRKYSIL